MTELTRRRTEDAVLSLGLFLLNLIFFPLILSTLLFVVGIPVSPFHFPAAVLAAAAVSLWRERPAWRSALLTVLIGLAILALILLLSGYVDDWSWDGNCYHKGISGALTMGWNPLRETFFSFAGPLPIFEHCTATWYDAYPKASELFTACVHAFSRNIEMGKAYQFLSMGALFFLGWGILVHTGLFRHWQAAVCAGLTVLHPVNTSQLLTFYNDGFLGNMLLLVLIGLLYFTFCPGGELTFLAGYLILAGISIGFNIKFSAVLFFAILCLTFFAFWAVREVRSGGLSGAVRALRGRFCLLAASVLFGTLFLGSTSYVTNTFRYHNPFYTMIGPGSTEIITSHLPTVYQPMGHLSRFIASLFSHTTTSVELTAVDWKLPFTFTRSEFVQASVYDLRVGGWGIFFSGIFLISAVVIAWALLRCRRSHPTVVWLSLVLSVMLFASVLVIPGLCWARYFTPLFLIPVAALLFLFDAWNRSRGRGTLAWAVILTALLCANMAPNAGCSLVLMKNASQTWAQLAQLKQLTETEEVILGYGSYGGRFEGRMFNIYDAGITNFTFAVFDPEEADGSIFRFCPLYYQIGHAQEG